MKEKEIIYEIIVPNYPSKIKLSNKQRAKYYEKKGKKKVPKKYLNDRFVFGKSGKLEDTVTGEKVIANPRVAGTPKMWNVNFQAIWNQAIKYQQRAVITQALKDIFTPFIDGLKPIKEYPVKFEIFIFDVDMVVDVGNKGVIYTKIIEDLLVTYDILPDDKSEYINDTGRCKWIKVDSQDDVRMVIHVSKSNHKFE